MSFEKAKPNLPYLRIALFGNAGSGKTYTALELAQGLAGNKRVAFIDTDPGAPAGLYANKFDFDLEAPADIDQMESAIKGLNTAKYGVLILDTVTWFWRALTDADDINRVKKQDGTESVQFNQWNKIKRHYRDVLISMLNLPCHLIITGREQVEYDMTGQQYQPVGYKMMAEKETAYELNLCIRLFLSRIKQNVTEYDNPLLNLAEVVRDRTGILSGKRFQNLSFKDIEPLTAALTGELKPMPTATEDAIANQPSVYNRDAEKLKEAEAKSANTTLDFKTLIFGAKTEKELTEVGKQVKEAKRLLTPADVEILQKCYQEKLAQVKEKKAVKK